MKVPICAGTLSSLMRSSLLKVTKNCLSCFNEIVRFLVAMSIIRCLQLSRIQKDLSHMAGAQKSLKWRNWEKIALSLSCVPLSMKMSMKNVYIRWVFFVSNNM